MWLMRHTLGYIGREGMNTKKILCTCVFMYKLQTPRHATPSQRPAPGSVEVVNVLGIQCRDVLPF